MTHLKRNLVRSALVAVLPAVLNGAALAQEAPDPLAAAGTALENALQLPPADRPGALRDVLGTMKDVLKQADTRQEKAAARFLSGEIHYRLGDYEKAEEQYKKAKDEDRKSPFADDAAFARICALEAAGKDEDAMKAWGEWEKDYPGSPLLPEAKLAESWNALRRGDLATAGKTLKAVADANAWMRDDPRFVLAVATAAYVDDRPDEALTVLGRGGDGAAETYLRAMCLAAKGEVLKAAAKFQEAAERFPDSPIRDHALLAKANTFLHGAAYRSAAEEFSRVAGLVSRPEVRAEAELRHAASVFLAGDPAAGADLLRQVVADHPGTGIAARAQFLLGEALFDEDDLQGAIVEYNGVLTDYFEHELAASAQYRVGQCLDRMDRDAEATSAYQAVVSGYPQTAEAPAAAYLAGVGLLDQKRPQAAVPYFQLVLDRYARTDSSGAVSFATPDRQELVEASLCLLELAYHRTGNLGQLSGAPHLMLTHMPPSKSGWRAYALLIDSDALASQGRYDEAQAMLEQLIREFPGNEVGIHANRLLAWTYARQGENEKAIRTEERMLARYAAQGDMKSLASAYLNKAHALFNEKQYKEAARAYEDYTARFAGDDGYLLALYQAGLCYLRLNRAGDATDRWEQMVSLDPKAEIAERAWVRAGDVYFQAEHYEDAKRCYQGLLENFARSSARAMGMLRMAQCDYNAGRDEEALDGFSAVVDAFPGTPHAKEASRGIEMTLYRLGQKDNGAEVLAELVEKYPNSSFAADAQFQVAQRHYDAGDFAEAAEDFRRVITQFPGYSSADKAYYLMGDAYAQAGAAADAQTAYEQFLMFFPDSDLRPTVQFRTGALRFDQQDYMRAAVDFTAVLDAETAPEIRAASLFNLALCHRMMGQDEKAQELLERYRSTYPKDERAAEVAYQLADIDEKAGRTDQARAEMKAALAGASASRAIEIHYRMGLALEQGQDQDGALAAYAKAIAGKDKKDAFRLSALARAAALYEQQGKTTRALAAYRDLMENATDPELVAAAQERASQLQGSSR